MLAPPNSVASSAARSLQFKPRPENDVRVVLECSDIRGGPRDALHADGVDRAESRRGSCPHVHHRRRAEHGDAQLDVMLSPDVGRRIWVDGDRELISSRSRAIKVALSFPLPHQRAGFVTICLIPLLGEFVVIGNTSFKVVIRVCKIV